MVKRGVGCLLQTLSPRNVSLCAVGLLASLLAYGDSQKMAEKRTTELIELNEQAVKKVPNLPQDGAVELKANVRQKTDDTYDIEIVESKIVPKRPAPHTDGAASVWDSRFLGN
jgi:hypothetical protein